MFKYTNYMYLPVLFTCRLTELERKKVLLRADERNSNGIKIVEHELNSNGNNTRADFKSDHNILMIEIK